MGFVRTIYKILFLSSVAKKKKKTTVEDYEAAQIEDNKENLKNTIVKLLA